jgi:hypothetical protein
VVQVKCGHADSALLPAQVVVDATNVYWTSYGDGTVSRCAIGGCGLAPTRLASGQDGAFALALDSTRVYWGNQIGGEIMALAK